ncbi:MAG: hypothetical protein R3D90_06445 [Paracoccaceae bacterium]
MNKVDEPCNGSSTLAWRVPVSRVKPNFEKRSDFLWIVQSTYLANGINWTTQVEQHDARRHEVSGLGVKNEMCDAVKASHLIPDDLDAVSAADEYITWKLLARSNAERPEQPKWVTPGFAGWNN